MSKKTVVTAIGVSLAIGVAMILERLFGITWLSWFVAGALMSISIDIIWIAPKERTATRIIISLILTGAAAAAAGFLADKFLFTN